MKAVNQPFLLSEEDEVEFYLQTSSFNGDDPVHEGVTQTACDTFIPGFVDNDKKSTGQPMPKDTDKISYTSKNTTTIAADQADSYMAYVTGIAFDPLGSGRKDHIAYVGLDTKNKVIKVWVLNSLTGERTAEVALTSTITSDWIQLTQCDYRAFFTITAGDYDNDGKDTFIVYNPGEGLTSGATGDNDAYLYQFKLTVTTSEVLTKIDSSDIDIFSKGISPNNYFRTAVSKQGSDLYRPVMSLTTGDFDGDGVAELAAACSSYKVSENIGADAATRVSLMDMDAGTKKFAVTQQFNLYNEVSSETDKKTCRMIYAGEITAGDVNGDGLDGIIGAGYTGTASRNVLETGEPQWSGLYNRDKENYGVSEILYDNGSYSMTSINTVGMNLFSKKHTEHASWTTWHLAAVACVAINGASAAEDVFLSGTLYSVVDGELQAAFTPEYFGKSFETINNMDNIKDHWVDSVTVGNFDGNIYGRQQIIFSVCAINDDSKYKYKVGILGGNEYDGSTNIVTSYYSSDIQNDSYNLLVGDEGRHNSWWTNECKQILNCVPVAVDRDSDGVLAKYVGKNYVYTDPSVLAVLQAAPYFGELGGYSDFTGSTSYKVTTSYTYGKTSSDNVSFGAGFAGEAIAGPVRISLELGYTLDWSKSYENSLTTSYTTTFMNGPHDQVILQRTPAQVYTYEVQKDDTSYNTDNVYQVTVPLEPVYTKLSVDEYNQFVDDYTAWYNNKFPNASDEQKSVLLKRLDSNGTSVSEHSFLPEDDEGNPEAYRNDWNKRDYTLGTLNVSDNARSLSKGEYSLGHSGGSTTSEWSVQSDSTKTITFNHGFHFSLTVQGGFEASQGALAGGYASLDYNHGAGHYTTNTEAAGASGTVSDIDSTALADKGIPQSVSDNYGFTWSFGSWEADLGGVNLDPTGVRDANKNAYFDGNVPFFGYAVKNIVWPSAPVTNLKATLVSDNSTNLTWSAPANTDRPGIQITGYSVYLVQNDGTYMLQAQAYSGAESCLITGLNKSNTDYSYVVTAECVINSAYCYSLYSNIATVTTPKKYYSLTYSGNANITVNYEGSNGNVASGDDCPEDTIIYFTAEANDGYALKGYKVQFGNDTPTTYNFEPCQKKYFNFSFPAENVSVEILTQSVSSDIIFAPDDPANGTVTASVGGKQLDGEATVSGVVTFEAAPNTGYVLKGWTINDGSTTETTVSDDGTGKLKLNPVKPSYTVTANFISSSDASVLKTITITSNDYGTIEVTDSNDTLLTGPSIKVLLNSYVTFKAIPRDLYSFGGWNSSLSGTVNPQKVKVTDDMTVGADFVAPIKYKVLFEVTTNGSPDPTGGSVSAKNGTETVNSNESVAEGSTVSFTATSNNGYDFNGWTVNGSKDSSAFDGLNLMISKKTTAAADFASLYTVTALVVGSGGTISPSGETYAKKGDIISYKISPDSGYAIKDVKVNGKSVNSVSGYDLLVIDQPQTITAEFEKMTTPTPNPGPGGGDETPETKTSERVSGGTRYDTMSSAITKAFEDGSSTVILASGGNWPDALAASSLAGAMECPVILTEQGQLTSQTADLISSLKATDVIIVGGTAAVSDDVKSTIESKEIKVNRIFGNDRTLTADAIEGEVMKYSTTDTVIICSGQNFPDALSISPYAYAQKIPILLTGNNGKLTDASLAIAKGFRNAILVGKEGAVSKDVETQLSDISLKRYGGNERYGTSVEIINNLFGGKPSALAVATGEDYPDALVGATLAGKSGGALLLVNGMGTSLTDSQKTIIGNADSVWVLGGNRVVSDAMKTAIDDALK